MPQRASMPADFWLKFKRSANGCLLWQGACNDERGAYGTVTFQRTCWLVHRLAWTLVRGVIPVGLEVCHTCDTGTCGEPTHLFLGTQAANMADKTYKGRAAKKLTAAVVKEIRRVCGPGLGKGKRGLISQRVAAKRYGVSQVMISYICRRQTWSHV